jgi:AcrR family transcriptional regulator
MSESTLLPSSHPSLSESERQPPRWKRRKESRPKEVIDAALTLFGEFGFAQTRLDDVAARAGISKGTIYLYFSSKQDLFEAVIHERAVPWLDGISQLSVDDNDTTEKVLGDFLRWGWDQFLASKLYLIAKIVLAESNNFPHLAQVYLREVMGPAHQHLVKVLERGQRRGEVSGVISGERVKVLLSPLSWLSLWRQPLLAHSQPPMDESLYVEEAIRMIVSSIGVPNHAARC